MKSAILNSSSGSYVEGLRPETLLKWNYVKCSAPISANVGLGDGAGAVAAGQVWGMLFPGDRGELYPCYMTMVGAFTTTGMMPQVEGAIPVIDASGTAVGLNVQLDGETTTNSGFEMSIGGSSTVRNDANACVVGQHNGYIDATFWTTDWTDYDCVAIGFRKVQAHQSGHSGILAAASGDPLYTDFAAFGIQSADDIQIATDLNNGGSGTYTDTTQAPTDSQNHRFRITLAKDGSVTYKHVGNAIAGAGALAAPTATASYTFDSDDVVVPYITVLKNAAADVELLLKDIEIVRQPSVVGHARV
mgnify:FL=1